jgi:hypothetical protein
VVSIALIVACLAGLYCIILTLSDMVYQMQADNQPVESYQVQVGRTLAMHRMRRAGIQGDWRNYTTQRVYGLRA